jgi:hypothetical protein
VLICGVGGKKDVEVSKLGLMWREIMRWWFGWCLDPEGHLPLHGHDSGILPDLAGSGLHVLQYIHFLRMHQP